MQEVSNDFHQAFKNPLRDIYINIKMNGIVYTNVNINSFEFDGGSMGGETFQIGSAFANTIKIEFSEIIEGLKELDQIDIELGIKTYTSYIPILQYPARVNHAMVGRAQLITYRPDEFEYIKLGTFFIKDRVDPDRNEGKTTVEAMDNFIFMNGSYESKLTYPAEIRRVALEIANLSGMKVNETTFGRLSATKIAKPEGYTFRQAIGLIAQFEAGFATFDKDGLLDIKTLSDPNFKIEPNEYHMKGLSKSEIMYRLGGISCKISTDDEDEQIIRAGSTNGAQVVLENRVMTQTMLNNIYTKIKDINYYPFTIKWRGNPALELGDWVTLYDRAGKQFKTPNLSYKLIYRGGLTAESSAETKTAAEGTTVYKGPIQQQIEYLGEMIAGAGGNGLWFGLDEPSSPKENDIWFKQNGPDKEMWVYKKNEDGELEWVLELSTAPNEALYELIAQAERDAAAAQQTATDADNKAQQGLDKANESLSKIGTIDTQIDNLTTSLATIDDKVVGIQTTVNGKADQSQVTQLSNLINQTVQDVEGNKTQIAQLSDQYSIVVQDVNENKGAITVLQNDINLMVKQGEVINQINISTEGILISGAKIQITGQTFIENAVIKSAMIDSVIADKINAGTLNAALVNVINLNASNISSGTINAINITGSTITGSRFVTSGSRFEMNIYGGSLYFTDTEKNKRMAYLGVGIEANGSPSNITFAQSEGYDLALSTGVVGGLSFSPVFMIPRTSTASAPQYILNGTGTVTGKMLIKNQLIVGNSAAQHQIYEDGGTKALCFVNEYGMKIFYNNGGTLKSMGEFTSKWLRLDNLTGKAGLAFEGNSFNAWGNFTLYNGTKNAAQPSRVGFIATPAYEITESYLGDIQGAKTHDSCQIEIQIDELFSDTINTSEHEYHVFLQSYGEGHVWVSERNPNCFIVESTLPNTSFVYEIKAKRRGYENERLVRQDISFKEIEEIYKETV